MIVAFFRPIGNFLLPTEIDFCFMRPCLNPIVHCVWFSGRRRIISVVKIDFENIFYLKIY